MESQMMLADDTHLQRNTSHLSQSVFFFLFASFTFSTFHPGQDLKFPFKGAISAPLAKWVVILLAMPTSNLYTWLQYIPRIAVWLHKTCLPV